MNVQITLKATFLLMAVHAYTSSSGHVSVTFRSVLNDAYSNGTQFNELNLATASFKKIPANNVPVLPSVVALIGAVLMISLNMQTKLVSPSKAGPPASIRSDNDVKVDGVQIDDSAAGSEDSSIFCRSDLCFNFRMPEVEPTIKRKPLKPKLNNHSSGKKHSRASQAPAASKARTLVNDCSQKKRVSWGNVEIRELEWRSNAVCEHGVPQDWECRIGHEYSITVGKAQAARRSSRKMNKDLYCIHGHYAKAGPKLECPCCNQ